MEWGEGAQPHNCDLQIFEAKSTALAVNKADKMGNTHRSIAGQESCPKPLLRSSLTQVFIDFTVELIKFTNLSGSFFSLWLGALLL